MGHIMALQREIDRISSEVASIDVYGHIASILVEISDTIRDLEGLNRNLKENFDAKRIELVERKKAKERAERLLVELKRVAQQQKDSLHDPFLNELAARLKHDK